MVELKKALAAGGYDVSKNNSQVYKAVRGLVRTETLVQTAGKGTLESYRFNTQVTAFKVHYLLCCYSKDYACHFT